MAYRARGYDLSGPVSVSEPEARHRYTNKLLSSFFSRMASLSPVITDFYASHDKHYWLVVQEPLLCCTILMISSRHHVLPGSAGYSRSFFIHQRLWQHCQHLLLRLMLGQEKASKAKTRTLGTIESLLLMTEWYPRSTHFPPDNDGWDADLLLTMPDTRDPPPMQGLSISERWKQDLVEPTKRADRMSWTILSVALGLAHELGLFEHTRFDRTYPSSCTDPNAECYIQLQRSRRYRLPKLLFIFINLMSSRLGCTSLVPADINIGCMDNSSGCYSVKDTDWESFVMSWVDLVQLSRTFLDTGLSSLSNQGSIFTSHLEQKKTLLSRWRHTLPEFHGMSKCY